MTARSHKAKVIGTDPRTDLALIKVEGGPFPYVKLSDKAPRIGDWVLAVGNPFGLGGTVTAGIVSARGRDIGASAYDDFIQIDAPVNKGNSGGPTFDTEGNVIGVNTAIFSPSGGSVGIAFAIPADTVNSVVAQLKEHGSVTRGWIGVQIQPVTPDIADSLGLKKARRRAGCRTAGQQPGAEGRHRSRRRHHLGRWQGGQGRPRSRQEDRGHGAEDLGEAHGPAQGRGENRHPDARRVAECQKKRAPTTARQRQWRADIGKLGLTLAPAAASPAPAAEGVVVTGVDSVGWPPTMASRPATSSSKLPANQSRRRPMCAT